MSQENVEVTRLALQAFNDRDLDAVLAGLHNDVEAFPRLAAVEAGYRSHEWVRRWREQLLGAFPDFHAEILELRDLGEFMIVVLRVRGRGAESDTPLDAAVWHVNQFRDGKSSGGASTPARAKPSRPPGCGSRRCRRKTSRGSSSTVDAFNRGPTGTAWLASLRQLPIRSRAAPPTT